MHDISSAFTRWTVTTLARLHGTQNDHPTSGHSHCHGRLPVPAYDRDRVTAGVVHFGVGGFHRTHQAMYLDRLVNNGVALDWGRGGTSSARPIKHWLAPPRDELG
jgi:hypothetical protein